MGINFTVANEWYTALEFWNTMKESLSWEDLWIKVARPTIMNTTRSITT